jgi:hypothetical protein
VGSQEEGAKKRSTYLGSGMMEGVEAARRGFIYVKVAIGH